ncbi:type II toxin-antitoxin system PemK/MazF family toxin [Desulfonatronum thioautotrophicum]|uniref:type II toxin-antitoxin system PemK/MazF family toxin n=1 Tax=Desulfonatronum thioautotrophicum TaxID=617001 RepID=UPI0005EBBB0E|nr:type II toxin-antitoxin system PemK/MazF family toxin [Desulfonatronum thioautotrophicum]
MSSDHPLDVCRGDLVIVSMTGDYGKVRPALIVQHDHANIGHASIVVCPLSSSIQDAPLFRITITPSEANGLSNVSQVMVDKISAIKRERIRQVIGHASDEIMLQVNRSLALWLGL